MKRVLILMLLFAFNLSLSAQDNRPRSVEEVKKDVNYDESKVGPYTLEDPLTFVDGRKVTNASDWAERRKEILDLFQKEMYGQLPPKSEIYLETVEEGVTLGGYAKRKQVRMWFRPDRTGPKIDWLILLPAAAKGPVPTVLMLNYYGNHTILADKDILIPTGWLKDNDVYKVEDNLASEKGRGVYLDPNQRTVYPVGMILARGYGFVTASYADLSPDPDRDFSVDYNNQDQVCYSGIFDLWGKRDPTRTDNTTALMAWGWALMRGMDMIERDPAFNASQVLLTGSSRLGKAALIAGAFDERFPVVVPNETGGGGVPLAKRNFGENITTMTQQFTHWYCRAYDKYAGHEDQMPFDQHLFISCVAPRALLVEGFDEQWFDTKGEFLSLQAASPVWEMLGRGGLPKVSWPDDYDTSAIGDHLGYVRRDQLHGISAQDWTWMLDFADLNFKRTDSIGR